MGEQEANALTLLLGVQTEVKNIILGVRHFFAEIDIGWVNLATIVGAGFSVAISLFAIWFSKLLSDGGTKISEAIRLNTEAIQSETDAVHRQTKILRLDNLRYLYENSKGQDTNYYWHFRWRFETYDRIGATVMTKADGTVLGTCDFLIEGFSNSAEHLGFENLETEFYKVKIANARSVEGQTFPFAEDDLVTCFTGFAHDLLVSKGVDAYTRQQKYIFTIVGIGHDRHRSGEPTAETAKVYPRIKNS